LSILSVESKTEQKRLILKSVGVVATTCSGFAMSRYLVPPTEFSTVIIEEAGKVLECECLFSFSKSLKRLILVGDDQQMRSLVYDEKLKFHSNLDQPLLTRLQRLGIPCIHLNQQTRARSYIAHLYRGRYENLLDHWSEKNIKKIENLKTSVLAVNVKTKPSRSGETNAQECKTILTFVDYLVSIGIKEQAITILTPYKKQKLYISNQASYENIEICTVDEYQGKENDIILVSLTFTYNNPSAFLCGERRINVMTSRAKRLFALFGNLEALSRSPVWEAVLSRVKESQDREVKDCETSTPSQDGIEIWNTSANCWENLCV